MCSTIEHTPRTPWPEDFPDVVNLMTVAERDKRESYKRAKYAKNTNQAKKLMAEIRNTKQFKEAIAKLKEIGGGDDVVLMPISSLEKSFDPRKGKTGVGSNPLPMAIALAISDETGWAVNPDVVQSNIVGHTGADAYSRFAHPALFSGTVKEGTKYIIIDDHASMGGTMANCRGHIEAQGGKVIGMCALTGNRGSKCLRLSSRVRNTLLSHENFATIGCHSNMCERIFGYPIECLTNPEANQILHAVHRGKVVTGKEYNLHNFFNDVIKCRNTNNITHAIEANKEMHVQTRLNGEFTSISARHYLGVRM